MDGKPRGSRPAATGEQGLVESCEGAFWKPGPGLRSRETRPPLPREAAGLGEACLTPDERSALWWVAVSSLLRVEHKVLARDCARSPDLAYLILRVACGNGWLRPIFTRADVCAVSLTLMAPLVVYQSLLPFPVRRFFQSPSRNLYQRHKK